MGLLDRIRQRRAIKAGREQFAQDALAKLSGANTAMEALTGAVSETQATPATASIGVPTMDAMSPGIRLPGEPANENTNIPQAQSPADAEPNTAPEKKGGFVLPSNMPTFVNPTSKTTQDLESQALAATYGNGEVVQSDPKRLGQYGLGRVGDIEFKQGDTGRRMIYQDGKAIGYQDGFKTFDMQGNQVNRGGLQFNRKGDLAIRDGKYYAVDPSMDRNDPGAFREITEQEAMGIDRNAYNKWSSNAFNFIGFKKKGGMVIKKHQYGGTITEKLPRSDNWMLKDNSLGQFVSRSKPAMQIPRVGGHMLFDASVMNYGNNEKPRNMAAMQDGGTIGDRQTQFMQFIAQVFDIQDESQFRRVVQELGEDGLRQLQVAFEQGMDPEEVKQRINGTTQYKKGGTMICPEGQRLVFKNGGCMCQKQENGGKMRFRKKKELIKKNVNPNDTVHVGGRPYDISGGKTGYPKLTREQYRNLPTSKKVDIDLKDQARGRNSGEGVRSGKCGTKLCNGGKARARLFNGGNIFKDGGKMGSEYKDGIGKPSIIDAFVGRPKEAEYKYRCGGKTKKKLIKKRK